MIYLMLILGLFLLVFGGDLLVKGAVGVANKMGISPLVVGIVLVGFGTSTPELMASILAVFKTPPSPGIAIGNVVGSNIANILLILGVTALIHPIKIDMKSFKRDSSFLFLSCLFLVLAMFFTRLNLLGGIIFVTTLIYYIYYCYRSEMKDKKEQKKIEKEITQNADDKVSTLRYFITAVIGIALTMLGAKLLVDNSVLLARQWGISETVIGLTLVAVGTSLPELASSIMASIRKHNDVAFGNVVGSNIYNALFILGTVALLTPLPFKSDLWESILIMSMTTLWLICLGLFKQISRTMGFLFLIAYTGYIVCLM
ncbi:MAG: calcium/sodium antiporter [Alphaproteobacteria bacterium]|nr:calcium/sodium antiporter [Alphaproteobacteria bacterium]